jgi:hypothetical protein
MIFVFTVGVPAAYYFLLRRHLRYINPDKCLIQQKYPLTSPLSTSACLLTQQHRLYNKLSIRKIGNTSFLWAAYKPSYWWFECAEMLKKFLLTGLPLLTRMADGPERTEVVYGIAVGMVFAQWYKDNPYLNGANKKLQLACVHGTTMMLLVGSMAEYAEQSDGISAAVVVLLIGSCLPVLLFLVFAVIFPERADSALTSADDKADVRVSEQTARVTFHEGDAADVAQALGAASMDAVRDARAFARSAHSALDLAVLPNDSGGPGCRRADLVVLEKLGIPTATAGLWLSRGQLQDTEPPSLVIGHKPAPGPSQPTAGTAETTTAAGVYQGSKALKVVGWPQKSTSGQPRTASEPARALQKVKAAGITKVII